MRFMTPGKKQSRYASINGWWSRTPNFAGFMTIVGSVLVPVGGVLLAHFVLRPRPVEIAALYDPHGPLAGIRWPGIVAWAAGVAMYYLMAGGATVPSLVAAIAAYLLLTRRLR